MYNYTIRTPNMSVHVERNGDMQIGDGRNMVYLTSEEWQHVIEDVRAITHLRKRAGDWDD